MNSPINRRIKLCLLALLFTTLTQAQKIDSIFFHLYTDSLKKGTHNYINVDGKSADGKWIPLTSLQLIFTTSGGKFENNDLVLPADFGEEKVTISATLKSDTSIYKTKSIYIKTLPDNERLRTAEEMMRNPGNTGRKKP